MNALKSEKHELEKRGDRLGQWLFGSILVIVVGLIGEYVPDLLGATGPASSVVRKTGEFLVIAGVAGELVIHWLQTRIETRIREVNGRIGRKAERRIAKLKRLAEQDRLARVKLETKLLEFERRSADRDFSREERRQIIDAVRKFAGQRITVRYFPEKQELIEFALALAALLESASWKVQILPPAPSAIFCAGFCLLSTKDEQSREAGTVLVTELAKIGYSGIGPVDTLPHSGNPRLDLVVLESGGVARSSVGVRRGV